MNLNRHLPPFPLLASLLSLLLLAACSDQTENGTGSSKDAARARKSSIAALPNDPPADGSCLGWRRGLTKGRANDSYSVYLCLHAMAAEDWGRARAEAKQLADWKIQPYSGSGLLPLMNSLIRFDSPEALETYLVELGVIDRPGPSDDEDAGWPAVTPGDFLAQRGNAAWFDVETGTFPNDHHYLLRELAGLAESRLKEATFTEVPPSDYHADDEPYQLTGTLDGTDYQATAENLGDWYDLGAVLELLNRMAVQNALPERFVSLPTGDQTATVWVIDSERLATLTEAGLVELSESDQAMIAGKTAEQEAIEDLESNGAKVILR
jgi:hypothetical protein